MFDASNVFIVFVFRHQSKLQFEMQLFLEIRKYGRHKCGDFSYFIKLETL